MKPGTDTAASTKCKVKPLGGILTNTIAFDTCNLCIVSCWVKFAGVLNEVVVQTPNLTSN